MASFSPLPQGAMTTRDPSQGIPASAGMNFRSRNLILPNFVLSPLSILYSNTFAAALLNTSSMFNEVLRYGQTVSVPTPPRARISMYSRGQTLHADSLNGNWVSMTISAAYYISLGIEITESRQIQELGTYEELYFNDALQKVAVKIDEDAANLYRTQASPTNQGLAAGRMSRSCNLGAIGKPVVINYANVLDKLNLCAQVLDENNVNRRDRVVVVSSGFRPILEGGDVLRSALVSGLDKSAQIGNSQLFDISIAGFDNLIISNNLPMRTDPITRKPAYAILFGRRDAATLVVQQLEVQKTQAVNAFMALQHRLVTWGSKLWYPEAGGILYAELDNTRPNTR